MDRTELRAYVGLLILSGVYRSRGEAAESLWEAESGRAIFRATMPLKTFHAYSSLLRFDDPETRASRRASPLSSTASAEDRMAPIIQHADPQHSRGARERTQGERALPPQASRDHGLQPHQGRHRQPRQSPGHVQLQEKDLEVARWTSRPTMPS